MDGLELPSSDEPCRLCLKKCHQSYSMYVNSADGLLRELPKKILECIALDISDAEPYGKLVCSECICKLDYFYEFRENCRKCQTFFDEMMMYCQTEALVAEQQQMYHQQHVHVDELPEISFTGSDFLLDGSPNKDYEYIIQSLEKEDISFSANQEALQLKQELEISIQQNQQEQHHYHHQQGQFESLPVQPVSVQMPSSVDAVMPSEETCFNNLEEIVDSIAAQQNAEAAAVAAAAAVAVGYAAINDVDSKDGLDYDDFVGIESVDDNRDASISEIQVQEIMLDQKFSAAETPISAPILTAEIEPQPQPLFIEDKLPVPLQSIPVVPLEPTAAEQSLPSVPIVGPLQPPNDRSCDFCGKEFPTRSKLKIHRNTHLNVFPFKCPVEGCGKAFKSKIGLDEHVPRHGHIEYPISCEVCGKGFVNQSYLTGHMRIHATEKLFRCNICKTATFKTKKSLVDHKNRHLGLKPFECGQCAQVFTNQYLLQQHEQVAHSGVRFPCPECNKSFTCKSYLKVHLRVHRDERPFVCAICDRGHVTRRELEVHMTRHTGKKEFICDVCGKDFARLNALKFHRKIHKPATAAAVTTTKVQDLPG